MTPLLFDVFGYRVQVRRADGGWVASYDGEGGKRRPAPDLVLPPELSAQDVGRRLADVFHEAACPERPDARLLRGAGTVVLDFDSTVIRAESLEELVEPRLAADPLLRAEFEAITRAGMSGRMAFEDSLRSRLALAQPGRNDVAAFAARLDALLTPGMPELVQDLTHRGVDVWLISGGFLDCLRPAARRLGIPDERVRGVTTVWSEAGTLVGTRAGDPWAASKALGVAQEGLVFERPSVMVGDGATDRAVHAAGHTDAFVAFTEHARRPAVVEGARYEARGVEELGRLLDALLP